MMHAEVAMRLRATTIVGATILAAVMMIAKTSQGQDGSDAASRRFLLDSAQTARDRGDHAASLDFATRAGAIQMTTSVRVWIARELLELNRPAAALDQCEISLRELNLAPPTFRDRDTLISVCQAVVAGARPRVSFVRVAVPTPRPRGLRVRVAGRELHEALYDTPHVVEPGVVRVEATANGRVAFRQDVQAFTGRTTSVSVALALDSNLHRLGGRSVGPGPFVTLGVGALGLGAAGLFFGLRDGAVGELNVRCTTPSAPWQHVCVDDTTGVSRGLLDRAQTYNTLTNVMLGVGFAGIVGGTVWLIVDRATARREYAPRAWVQATTDGVVLGLRGAW
jgi:hypothetical protein